MADELNNEAGAEGAAEMPSQSNPAESQEGAEDAATLKRELHHVKSQQGRKISDMERRMNEFLLKADEVLGKVSQTQSTLSKLNPTDIIDAQTLDAVVDEKLSEKERTKKIEGQRYGHAYMNKLRELGDEADDEALHQKILDLVTEDNSPFNIKSHEDPYIAAERNYNKAMRHLLKAGKPVFKGKGDRDLPPSGSATNTKQKADVALNLSPEAQSFMNSMGLKPDYVAEALKE